MNSKTQKAAVSAEAATATTDKKAGGNRNLGGTESCSQQHNGNLTQKLTTAKSGYVDEPQDAIVIILSLSCSSSSSNNNNNNISNNNNNNEAGSRTTAGN